MSRAVEILVVSYNSADAVTTLLTSLGRVLPDAPVAIREHAASPDAITELRQVAASHTAPVRIEHDPSNPGFGAGCNALARSSQATWFLFLNPDAELLTWPWKATEPPRGQIIGPTMVDSGPRGAHYGVDYRVRDEVARSWLRRDGRRPTGRGFVSGAAFLVEGESFRRVGGFDERYFMFYEDIDFCLRANELGIPTIVDPAWLVRHAGGHSTRRQFGQSLRWSYESAVRFHTAHGHRVKAYRLYVTVDSMLRAIAHLACGRIRVFTAYISLAAYAARHRAGHLAEQYVER